MAIDLSDLLDRCRQGDDLAWEAFVRQFQGRVHGIASVYVKGNHDEARDLAQDVFIRLYETRGRWAPADHFVPWLVRVARNVCLDHLRRKAARPPAEDIQADEMIDLAAAGPTPETELATNTERRVVWRALQSLGRLNREMILLKEIQGFSLQEIADALHLPIGTVKSRSNRARLELAGKVLAMERQGTVVPSAE